MSERVRRHFARLQERDVGWLMKMDLVKLNKTMFRLMILLLSLSFLDVALTFSAYTAGPSFVELNLLAAALFSRQFPGFLAAIGLKYAVLLPIFYGTLLKDRPDKPVQIRTVKLAVFVALVGAVIVYGFIDSWNLYNVATYLTNGR